MLAHCYLKPELWMSMKEVVFSFWRLNRLHQSLLCFLWGKPIALFTSGSPLPASYSPIPLSCCKVCRIFLYATIDWLALYFLFYVWFKLNFYLSYFKFLNSISEAYLILIFTSLPDYPGSIPFKCEPIFSSVNTAFEIFFRFSSGTACHLSSGGACFMSRPRHRLTLLRFFRGSIHSLHARGGM